jgi:2-iminoacetate synthase ThiH
MTRQRAEEELMRSEDLTSIGMQADEVRVRLHPNGIVTYCDCDEDAGGSLEITFQPGGGWMSQLTEICDHEADGVRLKAGPGLMAVDYLRLVAICRLYADIPHIEVDWRSVGLKVSQLALRFGADDLGAVPQMRNEPNTTVTEEGIRRVIRDAGFVPKKRMARYGALAVL